MILCQFTRIRDTLCDLVFSRMTLHIGKRLSVVLDLTVIASQTSCLLTSCLIAVVRRGQTRDHMTK